MLLNLLSWHKLFKQKSQKKLNELRKEWTWNDTDLKFSVVEAFKKIVKRLVHDSIYRPKILQKNITRKTKELKEAGLVYEGEKVADVFEDDKQVVALAGETIMDPITVDEVKSIENELSIHANAIHTEWRKKTCENKS